MRAKIIADIAVIAVHFASIILWALYVPLKKDDALSVGEGIALLATIFVVCLSGTAVTMCIIWWIHKGK